MDLDDGKERAERGPDEEALIGIYKSSSTESNGSSVKVREVQMFHTVAQHLDLFILQEILTDTSNSDED